MKRIILAVVLFALPCVMLASSPLNAITQLFGNATWDPSQTCSAQTNQKTQNNGPFCQCYASSAHQESGLSLALQFNGLDSSVGLKGKTLQNFCSVHYKSNPSFCETDLGFVCGITNYTAVNNNPDCYDHWIQLGCNIND